jgi:hypothetical protein
MKSSSECYKIMLSSWWKIGAAGTTTLVSKTMPILLEADFLGMVVYNVYME